MGEHRASALAPDLPKNPFGARPGAEARLKLTVVPQGQAKPHTVVDAVPSTANIETIATWEKVSTQLIDDAAQTVTALESLLMQAALDKADATAYATITTLGNFTPFDAGRGR